MYRRLYFLFPDLPHATLAVDELMRDNIPQRQLHALARANTNIHAVARTCPSGKPFRRQLEKFVARYSLPICFLALASLLLLVHWASIHWLLIPLAILALNLLAIRYLATHIPVENAKRFQDVLREGEILLMVDVPFRHAPAIQDRLHQRHPEARITEL